MLNEKRNSGAENMQLPDEQAKRAWETLEDFVDDENFAEIMESEFPRQAAVLKRSGMNRRQFMKVMGASMMMGGLTLTGCVPRTREHEAIIPYVQMPEEIVAGRPLYFATTMTLGGYGTGIVLETHEGRPHRVDGNPNHPATLGGGNSMLLASILELYNPQRTTTVMQGEEASDMDAFMAAFANVEARLGDGSQLRILTETVTSPTLVAQMDALLEKYPGATWTQYDPLGRNNVYAGAEMAFGEAVETVYDFSAASVVLSLDADFLMSMPGSLRYARDFAAGRRVRVTEGESAANATMNRLYAVTSTPSNTGLVADNHISLRASEVGAFTMALAAAVGVDGVESGDVADAAFLEAVVADLQANEGASIVIAGDEQPAAVHALVHAINAALGNVGNGVNYTQAVVSNTADQVAALQTLVDEMNNGAVDALFIIGGNPVYNSPADVDFAAALDGVRFSVAVSPFNDETAKLTDWHIPQAHYIEAWGDALAYDGSASLVQPPIGALYDDVRSDLEIISMIAGDTRSAYDILRENWEANATTDDFDLFWRRSLHDGVVADSAFESANPSLSGDVAAMAAEAMPAASDGLEVLFRQDPLLYDGRFSYNSWLQELPNPITKISWDGVAMMNEATASAIGVSNGEIVEISANGYNMSAPAWIVPIHADNSISVAFGYGHGISGDVEEGQSFNAYDLRTSGAMWLIADASVSGTSRIYDLAQVQKEFSAQETEPARHGTLAEFQAENGNIAEAEHVEASFLEPSEYDYNGYAWGMTIDLTSCIGCNACMIGCQSENTIPSVGKEQVLQERDMHWLRVDLYYEESGVYFQPIPCMHCENAPCEQVCPVQATVHDHEGINNMIYNRCIGTRTCAANCPYAVRRFNFLDYVDETPILEEQRNPDVSVRVRGVMEKCTYCWQRINQSKITASNEGRRITDGELMTACQTACPTQAISFGDLNDASAVVVSEKAQPHNYAILEELNTKPRTTYLAKVTNPSAALAEGGDAGDGEETEG